MDKLPDDITPFDRIVLYAISLGGDTDTIASMACAIGGAYYGDLAIGSKWFLPCEGYKTAVEIADKICLASGDAEL